MNNQQLDPIHLANMNRWDGASKRWAECADSRGIWQKCHRNPALVFSPKVLERLKNIKGKRVCVLGSGDNQAVFALAGLGARVTSVDISKKQLEVAENRAEILGLKIAFLQSDVTDLSLLKEESFDLVYTGGHVAVWVSNIKKYYAEAARILSPSGLFIVDEYHPFRRIWKESKIALIIDKPYFNRGPFKYMVDGDVLYGSTGEYESFEFHWTVSDYFNAILRTGCQIIEVTEYGLEAAEWEGAPLSGLPENLLIIAKKPESSGG